MNGWIGTINFNSPTTYNASTIIGVSNCPCQTIIHSYQCTIVVIVFMVMET